MTYILPVILPVILWMVIVGYLLHHFAKDAGWPLDKNPRRDK